jgi:MFS transporter, OFA family, oxalate/formate antiporter
MRGGRRHCYRQYFVRGRSESGGYWRCAGIGTPIGPSAAGLAFDISHSYTLPILLSILGNVIAAIIMTVTARMPLRN